MVEPSSVPELPNDLQEPLATGATIALILAIVCIITVIVTYPWWRRKIPVHSFCACLPCLTTTSSWSSGISRINDCADLADATPCRTSRSADAAYCQGADGPATKSVAERDSFWCKDSSPTKCRTRSGGELGTVSWFTHWRDSIEI